MSPAVRVLPPGALQVERQDDGRRCLLRPFVVVIQGLGAMSIPKGFCTDYSSIPHAFGWLVTWERVDTAGVVHDAAYLWGRWGAEGPKITRAQADRAWRLVAQSGTHRANWAQAWVGWAGLRVGGWVAWRRYRARD